MNSLNSFISTPSHKMLLKAIYPIFEDLADANLLERCQLGATQNQNEALHHLIRAFCSKAIFQSKEIVELSTVMAVALWNTGSDSVLQMLRNVGIEPGAFTKTFLNRFEVDHVKKAAWHEKQQTKTARKKEDKRRKERLASTYRLKVLLMNLEHL